MGESWRFLPEFFCHSTTTPGMCSFNAKENRTQTHQFELKLYGRTLKGCVMNHSFRMFNKKGRNFTQTLVVVNWFPWKIQINRTVGHRFLPYSIFNNVRFLCVTFCFTRAFIPIFKMSILIFGCVVTFWLDIRGKMEIHSQCWHTISKFSIDIASRINFSCKINIENVETNINTNAQHTYNMYNMYNRYSERASGMKICVRVYDTGME